MWNQISFIESLQAVGIKDPWSKDSLFVFISNASNLSNEYLQNLDLSELQQKAFDLFVGPSIKNPTFITHYPVDLSPLS